MATTEKFFDWRLSIGNVITIASVVVGLVWGWSKMQATIETQAADMVRFEVRLSKIERERDDTRDRLTRIEVTMQQMLETQARILRAVERTGNAP